MILLSTIKPNPNNPRIIKDAKFKQLVLSLKNFPKMMALRPMVVDENNIVQGGNQRLKALNELKYIEIPDEWVKKATDFTEEELKEFIVRDNIQFGEHDFEMLANEYDLDKLTEWGLDVPEKSESDLKAKEIELKPFKKTHILLSFPPENMMDIQHLLQQITGFSFVEYEQSNN